MAQQNHRESLSQHVSQHSVLAYCACSQNIGRLAIQYIQERHAALYSKNDEHMSYVKTPISNTVVTVLT